MVRNRVLGLDFDGVITNPHGFKSTELLNLGYDVPPEHTSREYCINKLRIPLSVYELATYNVNVVGLLDVPLAKNSKKVINKLYKNIMIFIITSRKNDEVVAVKEYLKEKEIKYDRVYNTNRGPKLNILFRIKPIIFVDDTPIKLQELNDLNTCPLFLFRNVENQYYMNDAGWREGGWDRIHSWLLSKRLEKEGGQKR